MPLMFPFTWGPGETLPTSWDPTHGWVLSWLLPAVVVVLIVVIIVRHRRQQKAAATQDPSAPKSTFNRVVLGLLGVTAVLAVANYHDYGVFRYGSYLNEWDVYHYYLGTKYSQEVGYTRMYGATLLADESSRDRSRNTRQQLRDLSTYKYRPLAEVLAEGQKYRARFSDERWKEFVADVQWFRSQLPPDRWAKLLGDAGYNGTPAWSFFVGAVFTRQLSIRDPISRGLLLALDPLLIIGALACVVWAFGLRTALIMIIFIGTHYLFSWGHLKGALLRVDFTMCTVIAVCCVKKGHHGIAGGFLGWAILSRIFPVLFLAGPVMRLVDIFIRERRVDRGILRLLSSCGAFGALVCLGSVAYFGGIDPWVQWTEKMVQHYHTLWHWNLGFKPMMDVEFANGVPQAIDVYKQYAEEPGALAGHLAAVWVVRALVLVPALYFARYLRTHESMTYSFVFVFFMVSSMYYYYFILCVPLLFFAHKLEEAPRGLGLAYMFLTGVAGYALFGGWELMADHLVFFRGWKQHFQTYYYQSWMISLTACWLVVIAGVKAYRALKETNAS